MKIKNNLKKAKKEKKSRTTAFEEWKQKRIAFSKRCAKGYSPEAGELANFMEGLTPDGYNIKGKKVNFIERGEGLFPESKRISSMKKIRISK